jgi:hypothetical protein
MAKMPDSKNLLVCITFIIPVRSPAEGDAGALREVVGMERFYAGTLVGLDS